MYFPFPLFIVPISVSVCVCFCRKAAKATLILFPLLGVTYLLFLFPPQNAGRLAFKYVNSVLQSTQVTANDARAFVCCSSIASLMTARSEQHIGNYFRNAQDCNLCDSLLATVLMLHLNKSCRWHPRATVPSNRPSRCIV